MGSEFPVVGGPSGAGTTTFVNRFGRLRYDAAMRTPRSAIIETTLLGLLAGVLGVAYASLWPVPATGLPNAAFSADGRWLVQVGDDELHVVDLVTGAVRRRVRLPTSDGAAVGGTLPGGDMALHLYDDEADDEADDAVSDRRYGLDCDTGALRPLAGGRPGWSSAAGDAAGGHLERTDPQSPTWDALEWVTPAGDRIALPYRPTRHYGFPYLSRSGRTLVRWWLPSPLPPGRPTFT